MRAEVAADVSAAIGSGTGIKTGGPLPAVGVPNPELVAAVNRDRNPSRRRAIIVGLVLTMVCAVLFVLSMAVGPTFIPLDQVTAALLGTDTSRAAFTVVELRAPRAITALAVGVCFGVSGAVLQAMARNPLASPDVIGITAGSSAGAVLMIVGTSAGVGELSTSMVSTPVAALAGGTVTGVAVYRLAVTRGSVSPFRLVLVGIGVAAVLTSFTSWMIVRASIRDAQRAAVWLAGSLLSRTWDDAVPAAIAALAALTGTLVQGRSLRVMQLGEDTAAGLGVRVHRSRAALIAVCLVGAAIGTTAAGPISFVAFAAAPIARRLVGTSLTIVPSALVGAVIVLGSDLIGRTAFGPVQLPVGIITGVIGAPYLL